MLVLPVGCRRAEVIHEDDLVVALTDIYPIRTGHTQVVSREHVPYFESLPEATASRLIHVGQRLSRAMKKLMAFRASPSS